MDRRSGGGTGSYLQGLVAIAIVSTGIILVSYHLRRRLHADLLNLNLNAEQRRRRQRTKKVQFADDVAELFSEYQERRHGATAAATGLCPALHKASST